MLVDIGSATLPTLDVLGTSLHVQALIAVVHSDVIVAGIVHCLLEETGVALPDLHGDTVVSSVVSKIDTKVLSSHLYGSDSARCIGPELTGGSSARCNAYRRAAVELTVGHCETL